MHPATEDASDQSGEKLNDHDKSAQANEQARTHLNGAHATCSCCAGENRAQYIHHVIYTSAPQGQGQIPGFFPGAYPPGNPYANQEVHGMAKNGHGVNGHNNDPRGYENNGNGSGYGNGNGNGNGNGPGAEYGTGNGSGNGNGHGNAFGFNFGNGVGNSNRHNASSDSASDSESSSEKTLFFKLPSFGKKKSAKTNQPSSSLSKRLAAAKAEKETGAGAKSGNGTEARNIAATSIGHENQPDDQKNDLNEDDLNYDHSESASNNSNIKNKTGNDPTSSNAESTLDSSESDEDSVPDDESAEKADWSEAFNLPKQNKFWHGLAGIGVSTLGMVIPTFIFFATIASAPKRLALVLLHHPVEASVELLLVASIPFINYFVWNALCKGKTNVSRLLMLGLGSAFATGLTVSGICFASLFGARLDLANSIGSDFSMGFLWLGILSMACAAVSAYLINRLRLSWELPSTRFKVIAQAVLGMVLAVLGFAGSEYRPWCIRMAQSQAVSVNPNQKAEGLAWLRKLNPEREMRMECSDSRAAGLAGLFYPLKQSTQHQLYFALTGIPYSFRDMNATDLSSMPDDYLSRHVVGERIPNLELTRSSLTGTLHPTTLSSTLNWTFVVKNGTSSPLEARAELGLPPGAAITGLTVWHRGESEDADFVASGKIEGASQIYAGGESPAMVTDLGHGRALLHAYPVPPEEELKIRVAMVVPLKAEGDTSSSMITPQLIATNFGLAGEHLLRLRSDSVLRSSSSSMEKSKSPTGEKVISGLLSEKQLETNGISIFAERNVQEKPFVVLDKISTTLHEQDRKVREAKLKAARLKNAEPKDESNLKEVVVMIDGSRGVTAQIEQLTRALHPVKKKNAPAKKTVIRTIEPHYVVEGINKVGAAAPKHLVVVIDGSEGMNSYIGDIEKALRQIPETVPTSVIVASQENQKLAKPELLKKRLVDLKNIKFIGGQDNLKAVVVGSELAGETKGGALLWIHGPQPVNNEEIYIMSPYAATPSFYELSFGAGTDTFEFFKNHTEVGPFCQVPRDSATVGDDLAGFFSKWRRGSNSYAVSLNDTKRVPKDFVKPSSDEAKELITLRAIQECNRLITSRHFRKAARIAVAYGFVSPVSSALVSGQPKADAGDASDAVETDPSIDSQNPGTQSSKSTDAEVPATDEQAPTLQGATNGSIGPQGGDATVIMGVNTAGTVRVNNLANLEALLNIIANLGEILAIAGGVVLVIQGLASKSVLKLGEDIELGPGGKVVLGIIIATVGISIPGLINWLVASARDANLFS